MADVEGFKVPNLKWKTIIGSSAVIGPQLAFAAKNMKQLLMLLIHQSSRDSSVKKYFHHQKWKHIFQLF